MLAQRLAFAAVLSILVGNAAWGAVSTDDDIKITKWLGRPNYQTSRIGPFWAEIYADDTTGIGAKTDSVYDGFVFCAEQGEFFTPGNWYNITGVSAVTQLSGKTLTAYSAWVFEKFLALANSYEWNETTGPTTHVPYDAFPADYPQSYWWTWVTWDTVMNLYQQAIWAGLVGSSSTVGASDAEFGISGIWEWWKYEEIGIGISAFTTQTGIATDGTNPALFDSGNFKILNIATGVQDQMFFFGTTGPQPSGDIPEPASAAIWSLVAAWVVCGMNITRRRRRVARGAE